MPFEALYVCAILLFQCMVCRVFFFTSQNCRGKKGWETLELIHTYNIDAKSLLFQLKILNGREIVKRLFHMEKATIGGAFGMLGP